MAAVTARLEGDDRLVSFFLWRTYCMENYWQWVLGKNEKKSGRGTELLSIPLQHRSREPKGPTLRQAKECSAELTRPGRATRCPGRHAARGWLISQSFHLGISSLRNGSSTTVCCRRHMVRSCLSCSASCALSHDFLSCFSLSSPFMVLIAVLFLPAYSRMPSALRH